MKIRGSLQPGEYALAATRAHGVLLARPLAWGFAAMTAWSFASALGAGVPWIRYPALALALGLAVLALRGLLNWWMTSYIITSHRLIIRRGVSGQKDISIPLAQIAGVSVGPLFLLGVVLAASLTVRSRGQDNRLVAVPQPARFSRRLQQAQKDLLASG